LYLKVTKTEGNFDKMTF